MRSLVTSIVCLISIQFASADIKLPKIIGSNMVIQRNQACKIWGWGDKGEKVKIVFKGEAYKSKSDQTGKWSVILPAFEAGGPFEMIIEGKNRIKLHNVMIGEVWICSGQSNMRWPVENLPIAENESAAAKHPDIRLFTVHRSIQYLPADDIAGGEWKICDPATVLKFSAVGYYFGRHLHRVLDVPIGLISSNWGGTNIETWTSREAISTVEDFAKKVAVLEDYDPEKAKEQKKAEVQELLKKHTGTVPGLVNGKAVWAVPDLDMTGWGHMEMPQGWEVGGLAGVDGVVWFRYDFDLTGEILWQDLTLELGFIDDSDMTWINGHLVGETSQDRNAKRVYKIPAMHLQEGRNVITIRVRDDGGRGGLLGPAGSFRIVSGGFERSLVGTWRYRISAEGLKTNMQYLLGPNDYPTLLFNGMIHPLLNYSVRGAIWYQGEANTRRAYQYRQLFPLMIQDWRKQWNRPDMPFFFVQLANYRQPEEEPGESDWAELREAQSMALDLPHTGMAVSIDIGEADDIHPANKLDVGKRLALSAMKVAYGKEIVHSGPIFKEMKIDGSQAIITFDHAGSGLKVKDRYGYLKGFAIAGTDRKFHWARAYMEGNKVTVQSDKVPAPVAVRYGWADNPADVNLYNMEGLPASPFRTDDWPGITYPVK
jgi:sialate O-acetylesterase